ncbi:uncharacterized protein LOC110270481 isoform X1 [Arachis ipaensis]|uniref:uncharacterized protein LOC110270481 isoform X1 n=1 Tax=Arachis ipaensis TaxID=130454 RepID=UPI000A2B3154|nr:uncharacterized protein LOC110270481 isoform X1 [Arachis ipaensis]
MELLAKVETGIICFGMFMSATSISDRDKSPICLFEESHPVVSHAAHLEGIYSNFSSIFRPTPMLPQYAPGCLPPWRPNKAGTDLETQGLDSCGIHCSNAMISSFLQRISHLLKWISS